MRVYFVGILLSFFIFNVMFSQEEVILKSDKIEFDAKTQIIKAYDGVNLLYDDFELYGLKVIYYKEKQKVSFLEKVSLSNDNISIHCQSIDFFIDKKLIHASQNVEFSFMLENGEKGSGTCDKIDFSIADQALVLKGSPILSYNGSMFNSERLTININTGKIMGSGDVNLNMDLR